MIVSLNTDSILLFNLKNIIIYILIGYFFGSFPNGYIFAKLKGVNIFEVGSKNPGSTNIGRIFGKKSGRIIFVLDIVKTILPIIICSFFYYYVSIINKDLHFLNFNLGIIENPFKYNVFNNIIINDSFNQEVILSNIRYIKLIVGLGAIIGHNFSIFTRFKGGKGVTSTVAAIGCFNIFYAIFLFVTFKIICKITNYVSLSSILTLIIMFLSSLILTLTKTYPFSYKYSEFLPIIILIYMLFGIIRHSSNIKKLINGTENKIK